MSKNKSQSRPPKQNPHIPSDPLPGAKPPKPIRDPEPDTITLHPNDNPDETWQDSVLNRDKDLVVSGENLPTAKEPITPENVFNKIDEHLRNAAGLKSFTWDPQREAAALALADGYSQVEAARRAEVSLSTVQRWCTNQWFVLEVDRLTLITGIATKAERLRIAKQVVRQKISEGEWETKEDLLKWLKYALSETDGAKIDLTALFENMEG